MPAIKTQGWLPIGITFDRLPAIASDAKVRWIEIGSERIAEPFLEHTIARLRERTPTTKEIDTPLDTLIQFGKRLPAVRPAGMIFHVSHCGSTLLANAMRTAEEAAVISESRAITSVLRPYAEPPGNYLRQRWDRTRRDLLDALFATHACCRTGEPEKLIIKCTSVDILSMPLVRAWWPDVPCVVVVRDPIEVLVANLVGGWWMDLKRNPALARDILPWTADISLDDIGDEEYCARVLAELQRAALVALDGNCRVIDYEDLSSQRMRQLGEFFGLRLPYDPQEFLAPLRWYSKDPARKLPFRDDRQEKRKLATQSVIDAAARWARPTYEELRTH